MGKNFKLNRLYHNIFGEKFYKKLDFKWDEYPNRHSYGPLPPESQIRALYFVREILGSHP